MTDERPFYGHTPRPVESLQGQAWLLAGGLRELLTAHFSNPQRIELPELRSLIWQATAATPILIEVFYRWDPTTTERTPALIVKTNSERHVPLGIGGDRLHGGSASRRGYQQHMRLWVGSATIFAIGGSGTQAKLLAEEVRREFQGFSAQIACELNLVRFAVMEVGGLAYLKGGDQRFVVPVTVGYAHLHCYRTTELTPRLKRIDFRTSSD